MITPLAGLSFVEAPRPDTPLALRLAMALTGRIAADLGANVTRIENPETEPLRAMDPFVSDSSVLYAFLNAGKRLSAPDSADTLESEADVVLSADGHHLRRSNAKRQVQVRYATLGHHAPADTPASEFTVLAMSGLLNLVGEPDREPLRLGGHQVAYAAGLSAFAGAMGALAMPHSEVVNVSLLECAVWLNWKNVANGRLPGLQKPTSRAGRAGDWPVIRCKDGWIALVYQPGDWGRLCAAAGNPPRLLDPELANPAGRAKHAEEIASLFEQAWRDKTRTELEAEFMRARLPLGAVWSPRELLHDEQYLARGFLQQVNVDDAGSIAVLPRLPVLWNGSGFHPGPLPQTI